MNQLKNLTDKEVQDRLDLINQEYQALITEKIRRADKRAKERIKKIIPKN